jgi:hypothetical protein
MNHRLALFRILKAGWLAASLTAASMVTAAPVAPVAAVQPVPRSVFKIPANPKEGRDPFFPASTRPFAGPPVPRTDLAKPDEDLSSLVMQGVSGAPPHQLVIINNVTFAVGDEAEVHSAQGRIRIRCVEITGNSAVIEANGQKHSLHYGAKP